MRFCVQELIALQYLELSRGIVRQVFDERLALLADVGQNMAGKVFPVFVVRVFFSVDPLVDGISFHAQNFFKPSLNVFHDTADIEPFQESLAFFL